MPLITSITYFGIRKSLLSNCIQLKSRDLFYLSIPHAVAVSTRFLSCITAS